MHPPMPDSQTARSQALAEAQRANIYSLECILYEMLTGAPPYTGSSISDIVRPILPGPTSSAARANREVPREVDPAICRALARSPAERFSSIREFADALL
jgi:eukaryotic-like serine/threonine-protein kinase